MQPCVRSNDCRGAGHEECHSGNSAVEKQYTLHNWLSPSHFGTCIRKQERLLGTLNTSFVVTQQRKPKKAYSTFWKNKMEDREQPYLQKMKDSTRKQCCYYKWTRWKSTITIHPWECGFLHIPPLNTYHQAAYHQAALKQSATTRVFGWKISRSNYMGGRLEDHCTNAQCKMPIYFQAKMW